MPDTNTPNLNLVKPELSPFDIWGFKFNDNMDLIDAASITLRGTPVAVTAPALNQVLKFNGTSWAPAAESGSAVDASLTVKGVTKLSIAPVLASNPIAVGDNDPRMTDSRAPLGAASGDLGGSYPIPTVNGIRSVTVSSSTPTANQILKLVGGVWTPSSDLVLKQDLSEKGQPSGYASLDGSGKVPQVQLPAIAITDTFVVANQAARLALTAETGDVAIQQDIPKTFILRGSNPSVNADWEELLFPTGGVQNVTGTAPIQVGGTVSNPIVSIDPATVALQGSTRLSVAPVSAVDPISVGDNDPRVANVVHGSGTIGKLPKFTGGATLGDSIVSESGGALAIAGNTTVTGSEIVGTFVGSGGSLGTQVFLLASTDGSGQAIALASGLNIMTDLKATFEYDPSADRIKITKGSGTLMNFDRSTSNIGIGVNPDAVYKVTVSGDMNISGTYRVNGTPISGITGSGVANRVAFWSGASALSSNSNFIWDNSLNRFGVGTGTPLYSIHFSTGGRVTAWDTSGDVFISSLSSLVSFPASERVTLGQNARVQAQSAARFVLESGSSSQNDFFMKSAGGSFGAYTATNSGTNLGVVGGIGHNGASFQSQPSGFIRITAAENFTGSAVGTKMSFHTTLIGTASQSERVTILDNGNVGIDSTNPPEKFQIGNGGSMNLQGGGVYKANGVQISSSNLSDSSSIIKTSTALGSDLNGFLPNATVSRIQGTSVSNNPPSFGNVLRYNGTAWEGAVLASTELSDTTFLIRTSTSLGGDLSGNLPNATVSRINGVTVTGVPATGNIIVASSGSLASWQAPASADFLNTSGADVNVGNAAPPTTGQVLTATSSNTATWQTPSGGGGGYATVVVAAPSGSAATDTSNINAAFTTVSAAGGGTVILREGTYKIDAALSPGVNTTIIGQGMHATIVQADAALATSSRLIDTANTYIEFRDLTLDVNQSARGASGSALGDINLGNSFNTLTRVRMINCLSTTSFLRAAVTSVTIVGCEIDTASTSHSCTSPLIIGGSDSIMSNCRITIAGLGGTNMISGSGGKWINNTITINFSGSYTRVMSATTGATSYVISGNTLAYTAGTITTAILADGGSSTRITVADNVATSTSVGPISAHATALVSGNSGFSAYTGGVQSANDFGGGAHATYSVAAPTGVAATDTAAVSAALTAVSAAGGLVILRDGTYAINATLTVPTKVVIRGQNRNSTVLQASGLGTVPILVFSGTESGMESLTVDMNFGARGTLATNDITVTATFVVFNMVRFINATSTGNGTVYFLNETVPQGIGSLLMLACEFNGGGSLLGSYGMAHRNAVYSNCQFNFNTTNAPNRVVIIGSASGMITMAGCQVHYASTATSLSFIEDVLSGTLVVGNNHFLMTGSGNVTSFVQVGSGSTRAAVTGNVCQTTGAGTMGGITGLAKTSITGNVGFVTYNGGTQSGNIA